jgi:hypothetical protein
MAYFSLYRRRKDPSFQALREVGQRNAGDIPRFAVELLRMTSRQSKILEERQSDPELESARARVGRLVSVLVATGVIGFVAFMVVGFLSKAGR